MLCIISVLIFIANFASVFCSAGDNSRFYRNCVHECRQNQCKNDSIDRGIFINNGQLDVRLWSCSEKCEDICMWSTVEAFQERGWPVPQFHGKWPFVKAFGLQEPASVIFSLANLWVVKKSLTKFRRDVRRDSPYYWLWHFYYTISMNCWVWSAVYHTRDVDVTERLDYIAASILVFTGFFCMTVRTLQLQVTVRSIVWGVVCASVLINHCAYLWYFPFDYSYNMAFNVIVGALAVAGWLIWSAIAVKQSHPCPIQVAAYCVLLASAMLLELLDFPPLLWFLDAHALWHLSTCFIAPLFFSFIVQDVKYLRNLQFEKLLDKIK